MKARMKIAIAIGAATMMIPLTRAVAGIDVQAGDWKIDFSGNVNAFYVNADCDHGTNTAVVGGLACTGDNSAAVRNGLLPAALVFSATTRQDNFDIGVTIGFYPGINSSAAQGVNGAGLPSALQTPGIDARQVFLTFGDASWGSVKMGRDIGLFGKDAILDDMTLLGVGTAAGGNAAPGNTSLGRIGIGYIYTDWEPQITYTTPNLMGFTGSVGAFQPLDDSAFSCPAAANPAQTCSYSAHSSPQWQVGLAYSFGDPKSDPLTFKVWVDAVTQDAKAPTANVAENNLLGVRSNVSGSGADAGVKLDVAGFEGVLYGYVGHGLGTTGLYILATDAFGNERNSSGGYAQATYKIDRLKVGLSYGLSDLKMAQGDLIADNLVKRNESGVFGLYYGLTKSLTLVGEFIDSKSTADSGNVAREKDVAVGGIPFF
jgi:predicted porin